MREIKKNFPNGLLEHPVYQQTISGAIGSSFTLTLMNLFM